MEHFAHPKDRTLAVAPAEAARMLGIGRTRLYEEIGSGALRTFKLGSRRLVSTEALHDWIAAREAEAQIDGR